MEKHSAWKCLRLSPERVGWVHVGRVEPLAPSEEDSSASASINWEGATEVREIILVYAHSLEQQAAGLVLSPPPRLLLFPSPSARSHTPRPDPALRALTTRGPAPAPAERGDLAGMVEGLMASAS